LIQLDPATAAGQILAGTAPAALLVRGSLKLRDSPSLTMLPPGLVVTQRLDLSGCTALETLPDRLQVGALLLRGCTALGALPEGLSTSFLDATGCAQLETWPSSASIEHGHVILRNCTALRALPSWLRRVGQLDLAGCSGISEIPAGLAVSSFLDLADTAIRALPPSLSRVELRWRGVRVDARIAFQPEAITPEEVLGERNAELRRVLLERLGYERFLEAVGPTVVDEDVDPGGPRALLRVTLEADEPLLCLVVRCPSTAQRYVLRVPPTVATCRQAAAWIAGFDDPAAYAPVVET
jgi:hypothetical protein